MKKILNCKNFRPLTDIPLNHHNENITDCSRCVYFSSRNCGHDIADSLETELDIF